MQTFGCFSIVGMEKEGKTDFSLRWLLDTPSPLPAIVLSTDPGTRRVVLKLQKQGAKIVLHEFLFVPPISVLGAKTESVKPSVRQALSDDLRPIFTSFITTFMEEVASKANRAVIVDTGTGAYILSEYAKFGKLAQIPPMERARLKAEFAGLMTYGNHFSKTVIWTHRLKDEWKNDKPTGGKIRQGYADAGYEVDAEIRVFKAARGDGSPVFGAEVILSGWDQDVIGDAFLGENAIFPRVASRIFGAKEKEWR